MDAPQGRRRRETNYQNTKKMVDIEELEIEHDREYHAKRIQYMEKKCSLMEPFLDRLDSLLAIEREQLEEQKRFHALSREHGTLTQKNQMSHKYVIIIS